MKDNNRNTYKKYKYKIKNNKNTYKNGNTI